MFRNKVVIVTGASAGIGAAIAECFAKEGASLAIIGRNEAKLKSVAEHCEDIGANVLAIKADVSKDDAAKTIVKQTVDKYGTIDVVVNNAAIIKIANIADSNMLQIYDEIVNTNLRAIVNITNLAIPYLKETKGNVINVSSVASMKSVPGLSAYSISKAGLDQFTKCAAVELASSGVRVNTVNPGPVETDMLNTTRSLKHWNDKTMEDVTALGRISEANEIGELVLFLASDKAKSVTGSCYIIDNGSLLK